MTAPLKRLHALLWLASPIAVVGGADASPAAHYSCAVPRALLCDNCATALAVTLLPGGGCRISFTPPVSPPVTSAALPAEQFSFTVISPGPAIIRRSAPGGWRGQMARERRASEGKSIQARCFVFNGNSYCE
jgi:hypothetical protein